MNEREWIEYLQKNLFLNRIEIHFGQGSDNQVLPTPSCNHKMQFGDLRIETLSKTIVIEVESAGGIDNFIKYWPYLSGQTEQRPIKDFVLFHIYGISYPTHKALWLYFHDRLPSFIVKAGFHLIENGDQAKEELVKKINALL